MKSLGATVLCLVFATLAPAQPLIAPPPPALPEPAAPAAPKTIWGFFGINGEKLRECKQRFCQTTAGQMANNMLAPIRLATGGLVCDCCPPYPTKEELARLKPGEVSPAEEVAARIKFEEAGAKARRAAVRYLGTVDCHYYPEAEAGLIAALRADRNECVRMEAARALGNGCCCTQRTVAALNIVVNGDDADGNHSETSDRVKICAFEALTRCMSRGAGIPPPVPSELPHPTPLPSEVGRSPTLKDAEIALASYTLQPSLGSPQPIPPADPVRARPEPTGPLAPPRPRHSGRSLLDIVAASTNAASDDRAPRAAPPSARLLEPTPTAVRGPDSLTPIGVIPQ
jgi:hypothetical protein